MPEKVDYGLVRPVKGGEKAHAKGRVLCPPWNLDGEESRQLLGLDKVKRTRSRRRGEGRIGKNVQKMRRIAVEKNGRTRRESGLTSLNRGDIMKAVINRLFFVKYA